MIIYGCKNGKLKDKIFDDISISNAYTTLKEKNIYTKTLPGNGNLGLKKKETSNHMKKIKTVVLN